MEQINLNSRKIVGFLPRPALTGGQKGAYGIYVRGSPMSPRYEDGQTVFVQDVRLGQPPPPSDNVVVYLRRFSRVSLPVSVVLLKRLVGRTRESVVLEQSDPPLRFKIDRSQGVRIDRVIPLFELLS